MQKMDSYNIEIRAFKKDDLGEILSLVKKMWPESFYTFMESEYGLISGKTDREWVASDIDGFIEGNGDKVYVTEVNGLFAGFCSYTIDAKKQIGQVGYNAVNPDFQGMGIGSRQLQKILELIKEEKMLYAKVITSLNDAHVPARKLYEKYGFKVAMENVTYAMKL